MLADFLLLTTPAFFNVVTKHGVKHFIPTVGPLVSVHAGCLNAVKFSMVKEEFTTLECLGIVKQPVALTTPHGAQDEWVMVALH